MILLDKLSGATTTGELRQALQKQSRHWGATQALYLTYDDERQRLLFPGGEEPLSSKSQPGQAALALRPCFDQALVWPDGIESGRAGCKVSFPVLHWGSLIAVVLLEFDVEPDASTKAAICEAVDVLGVVGNSVLERERTAEFVLRTQELLVHAVEAQGKQGHVGRVSRVATALASMLDCSAQARAELMQAAQYHDVGLLAFPEPKSAAAVREHSQRGARLLECHPNLASVASLVEAHHEKYDGSGFPVGHKNDELPLEAWILALTEDLVESWESAEGSFEERVRIFFHSGARHHHPDAVDALCGLVDSGKLQNLLEG